VSLAVFYMVRMGTVTHRRSASSISKATHPKIRLRLFAASASRLRELSVLDFSFAESFTLWNTIPEHSIDEFWQFQVDDQELQTDVLEHLPPLTRSAVRIGGNRFRGGSFEQLYP
jgi:hypothetical protein